MRWEGENLNRYSLYLEPFKYFSTFMHEYLATKAASREYHMQI